MSRSDDLQESVISLPCGITRLSGRLSPAEPPHTPCFLSKTCATAQPYYTNDTEVLLCLCMYVYTFICIGGKLHMPGRHMGVCV